MNHIYKWTCVSLHYKINNQDHFLQIVHCTYICYIYQCPGSPALPDSDWNSISRHMHMFWCFDTKKLIMALTTREFSTIFYLMVLHLCPLSSHMHSDMSSTHSQCSCCVGGFMMFQVLLVHFSRGDTIEFSASLGIQAWAFTIFMTNTYFQLQQ